MKNSVAKKIFIFSLMILGVFFVLSFANAQGLSANFGQQSGLPTASLQVVVARIINAGLGLLGLVAVMIIIYAGYLYMTARGEVEKVQKAKKLLIQAVIGLLIISLSFAISSFILYTLSSGEVTPPCTGSDCPSPQPCTGSDCPGPGPFPTNYCQDPDPNSALPWVCINPTSGKRDAGITVNAGKFGSAPGHIYFRDKNGVLTEAEILKCKDSDTAWFKPQGSNPTSSLTVKVPKSLNLVNNPYKIVVVTADDKSSFDKTWGLTSRKDIFSLTSETDDLNPILICVLDPATNQESYAAKNNDQRTLVGQRFGSAGDVKYGISDSYGGDSATESNWQDTKTDTIVPKTVSGWVKVFQSNGTDFSNGKQVTITCSASGDCNSGCCKYGTCQAANACLPGLDESCDSNNNTPACEIGACQSGLLCDSDTCKCRAPKVGDKCSSSPDSCVIDDTKCGQEFYCATNCTCQQAPEISAIDPNNGAVGNFVTIYGNGFGTQGANSKVVFLGSAAAGDDKDGILPTTICKDINVWQNNQIIVQVPEGAVSGKIQVKTDNNLEATSTDSFTVNDTVRPALCGALTVKPDDSANKGLAQGFFKEQVQLTGKNFGSTKAAATIGNNPFNNETNWQWFDTTIDNLLLPNLRPGTLKVQLKVGTVLSNSVYFKLLAAPNQPIINDIDPKQGQTGQYITISGSNFGNLPFKVKFDNGANKDNNYANWQDGLFDFPASCANNYWKDSQIIVKVPSQAKSGAASLVVVNQSNQASNEIAFNHCTANDSSCRLTPGICSVSPNKAPAGNSNIVISGDNFGTYDNANSKVTFYNEQNIDSLGLSNVWTARQIGLAKTGNTSKPIIVPAGAKSGPLYVRDNSGTASNKINFQVADCRTTPGICANDEPCCQQNGACLPAGQCQGAGAATCTYQYTFKTANRTITLPPQVVESQSCLGDLQSPSPYKNKTDACINAEIYARFNQDMDADTLTTDYIKVYACNADKTVCTTPVNSSNLSIGIYNEDFSADSFTFTPGSNFTKNTWYKVILLDNITSSAANGGIKLDGDRKNGAGGNYEWYFKTKDSDIPCVIASASVNPTPVTLKKKEDTKIFTASAKADNCNLLSGYSSWSWSLDPSDSNVATLSDALGKNNLPISAQKKATAQNEGSVHVVAQTNGIGNFAVLNVDFSLPVITDFTPKDGLINEQTNSYVTITGSNFGTSKGSSQVLFENSSGTWTEATLANCGEAWSDTQVKVVVPKIVKTSAAGGASLKIITPYGEDTAGDKFLSSENVYPFLCAAQPNHGKLGLGINLIGDNLGDSNKTKVNAKTFGIGSFIKLVGAPNNDLVIGDNSLKTWGNKQITYSNPYGALNIPSFDLYASIDPQSDPYNDTVIKNGQYDQTEDFAPRQGSSYTKATYNTPQGASYQYLNSNQITFYQEPVITSLGPDNGPVDQWVTIFGYNFGNSAGHVYFPTTNNGYVEAALAPCKTNWTNNYIIAVVPSDAITGNNPNYVYIKTALNLDSNKDKRFTVNNNPLGAGLCALVDPAHQFDILTNKIIEKETGKISDPIMAIGDRFGDSQGTAPNLSNFVFSPNQNATPIVSWSDAQITATIPVNTANGPVKITKLVQTGERCVGFSILSYCASNRYEPVYQAVDSNSLPLRISDTCDNLYTLVGRDKGFPVATDNTSIDLGLLATDGKYLYSQFDSTKAYPTNFYGAAGDNMMTIWKIGKNASDLGHVYDKYKFDGNYKQPPNSNFHTASLFGYNSLLGLPDGLYASYIYYSPTRTWMVPSDPQYSTLHNTPFWGIYKIVFNETAKTYSWEMQQLPQGVLTSNNADYATTNLVLKSGQASLMTNGKNIFAVAADLPGAATTGYTVQVLDMNWKQIKQFTVPNAPLNAYFTVFQPWGFVDDHYIYLPTANSYMKVIDWQKGDWASYWNIVSGTTKEFRGVYDWTSQKYFSSSGQADINNKHNLLYRYSKCSVSPYGYCRTEADCTIGTGSSAKCPGSTCVKDRCTPVVKSMAPTSGLIGQWVDLQGCYLGCDAGKVYFSGNPSDDQIPTNGLIAGYRFNSTANNGLFSSSLSSPVISSELKDGATISDGVLNATAGYLALDERLGKSVTFGGADWEKNGKLTLLLKVKPTSFVKTGNDNIISLVSGIGGILYVSEFATGTDKATLITYANHGTGDPNLYSTGTINRNQWNNIAVVLEAGVGYKVYINGQLTDNVSWPDLKLNIWNYPPGLGTGYQKFNGQIDDVLVYKRALSDDEVLKMYQIEALPAADSNGVCSDYWSCSANYYSDHLTVAVPNKTTPTSTDDAISGPVTLKTKDGYTANAGPFTVLDSSSGTLPPQVCRLADCGNGTPDGKCSDATKDTKVKCLANNNTWSSTTNKCSNLALTTMTACLTGNKTWTGEQCDGNTTGAINGILASPYVFEYDETCAKYGAPANCVTKCSTSCKTLVCDRAGQNCKPGTDLLCSNNNLDGSCSDETKTDINSCLSSGSTWTGEECDGGKLNGATCNNVKGVNYGTGSLACYASGANKCKFNISGCSDAPDLTQPFVESTLPANGASNFCRNGIVDIYFSERIDPSTITKDNFKLGTCNGGLLVKAENKGWLARAADYFANIFYKLIGLKRQALAEDVICNPTYFPVTARSGNTVIVIADYNVSYANIIKNNKPITVVYLELTGDSLLAAGQTFNVGILPNIKDLAGNLLDISNTKQNIKVGGSVVNAYAFGFTTLAATSEQTGICDADGLSIDVYHLRYTLESNRVAEPYVSADNLVYYPDWFRCAGKNDCALDGGNTIPADYDQDGKISGNQHIYLAYATSSANSGGYHLSVTYDWNRSDASDPAKMLTLSNPFEDTSKDLNVVQNRSGLVYVTPSPLSVKENTSLLIAQAQAKGSIKDPVYKIFRVNYIGCAYPWVFPSALNPFESLNSETWYCRDRGTPEQILPDAGQIAE